MAFAAFTFINRDTVIHRLHPSVKFLMFVVFMVTIFMPNGFFGLAGSAAMLLTVYFLAGIKLRTLWATAKSMIFLFSFLLLINWVVMKTDTGTFGLDGWLTPFEGTAKVKISTGKAIFGSQDIIFTNQRWGGVDDITRLSAKAIWLSLYVTIKILCMIMAATILTTCTSPSELTYAIEDLMKPLKIFKLPVNEVAMMISIALRYIPTLVEESQRIMKAQASRGIDFKNGKLGDKFRSLVSLIVPLFSIAFQKADDLSNAMEARSYNPRYVRTRYRAYKLKVNDFIIMFVMTSIMTFFIYSSVQQFIFAPFGSPEGIVSLL